MQLGSLILISKILRLLLIADTNYVELHPHGIILSTTKFLDCAYSKRIFFISLILTPKSL